MISSFDHFTLSSVHFHLFFHCSVMELPPRKPKAHMITLRSLIFVVLQGLVLLAGCMLVYYFAVEVNGDSQYVGNTMAFGVLTAGNITVITVDRSWAQWCCCKLFDRNRAFWIVSLYRLLPFLPPCLYSWSSRQFPLCSS